MTRRILIVDDETNIRTMMRLSLQHAGYEVDVAADGQEALTKFGNGDGWDLVLLDQRMPGMPGIEVQREVYRRDPDARLILITAFGTIDLALEAIQAGASDFLRKPFTAETLRLSVESALDRPVKQLAAVPVGMVCREFTRTTFNGYSFELENESIDEDMGDIECTFTVNRSGETGEKVRVILPAFVMELVKAYADTDCLPCGHRFWVAMCEESLANYLWQNATRPEDGYLRIDDLNPSIHRWLDSVLTVRSVEENHV